MRLVQRSVDRSAVGAWFPVLAATPSNGGIVKYVASHAAGAHGPIIAASVNVTMRLWSAATVSGVTKVWTLPRGGVEAFQITSEVVREQPICTVRSVLEVYPAAKLVFAGRSTALIVTGCALGLSIVMTTSPVAPGYRASAPHGEDVALMARLDTVTGGRALIAVPRTAIGPRAAATVRTPHQIPRGRR
jgi:hypothetical protein